jgi:hypothetical protein
MKPWILAVIVVAILAVAGGGFLLLSVGSSGSLVIGVTDSPTASTVSHVYITMSDITLQGASNSTASYKVNSGQFDLLALVNVTKLMGTNQVSAGNYTMIRFTIVSAIATISGANVTLTVPSGELKVPIHFEVQSGKTTTMVLDITVNAITISASQNLSPVVHVKSVAGPS